MMFLMRGVCVVCSSSIVYSIYIACAGTRARAILARVLGL
jgi:hypothetical protein